MGLAVLHSRALSGFDAPPVEVEVNLAGGLPAFNLVGLPETEVKESRDRVRAAIQNAQFEFPTRRITVNLAPADLPKESARFDLPIALGVLAATGQIPKNTLPDYEFAGELALTGDLRPIRGALAMTLKAHRGVLFLDELPEWDRKVLEVLREPIESGRIHISRAARQATFPARFQFIAAMNPCPCGYLGHHSGKCRCTPDQIARYRARISGPLLDRIDLQIEVPALPVDALPTPLDRVEDGDSSAVVRVRVAAAAQRQRDRQGMPNAWLQ